MNGFEILNLDTLKLAYNDRMNMLHPYISLPKRSQTSSVKHSNIPLHDEEPIECDLSIAALIQRAKNECRNIVPFLQQYITVEVIKL